MHILFVHQNFPSQFGHVASYLAQRRGDRCTFVSEKPAGMFGPIELIQYRLRGGVTGHTHYCSRTFENHIWHSHAIFEALKARPDIRPDLIVGHSGLGSTLFLRELYDVPIVNYFEYFYRARNSDMDFRPDFPNTELQRLRAVARNAMILLDLENCDAGYSPTFWQRNRLPVEFHNKVSVIFDGIDTSIWHPVEEQEKPRRVGTLDLPPEVKVVTYATRGMESMRGFDIFMKFANQLSKVRPDVTFVVAGQDRVCYGGDESVTGSMTFKEWVLSRDVYDLSRFHFVGLLPPSELAQLYRRSDLHVYLTVPFVLSWSLLNALACGSIVLASNTEPVAEVVTHGFNGLLQDFFDVDGMVSTARKVLDSPSEFAPMGRSGAAMVRDKYSLEVCLPQMIALYEQATHVRRLGNAGTFSQNGANAERVQIGERQEDAAFPKS